MVGIKRFNGEAQRIIAGIKNVTLTLRQSLLRFKVSSVGIKSLNDEVKRISVDSQRVIVEAKRFNRLQRNINNSNELWQNQFSLGNPLHPMGEDGVRGICKSYFGSRSGAGLLAFWKRAPNWSATGLSPGDFFTAAFT